MIPDWVGHGHNDNRMYVSSVHFYSGSGRYDRRMTMTIDMEAKIRACITFII